MLISSSAAPVRSLPTWWRCKTQKKKPLAKLYIRQTLWFTFNNRELTELKWILKQKFSKRNCWFRVLCHRKIGHWDSNRLWFDTKRHLAPLTFDQYWSIVVCYQFYCVESVNALDLLSNPFWQATNTSSSQVNYNDYIGTPANGLSRFFPLFVYKMNYHTKINDYFKSFFSISTFQEWESRKSSSEKNW